MGKFATINIKRAWVNIGYFSSSWSGGVEKSWKSNKCYRSKSEYEISYGFSNHKIGNVSIITNLAWR